MGLPLHHIHSDMLYKHKSGDIRKNSTTLTWLTPLAGVVNRSQQDIISQRNIGEARAAELEFFNAHAEYSSVTAHCGLHNLAKALNHILVEHIRALLPSLKTSIEEMLDKRFHELKLYGDPMSGQSAGSRSDDHLIISLKAGLP